MDLDDRDDGLYYSRPPNVIIVPAMPYNHEQPKNKKGGLATSVQSSLQLQATPAESSGAGTNDLAGSPSRRDNVHSKPDPSNFLLRGGVRAVQAAQQLQELNSAAVQVTACVCRMLFAAVIT